MSSNRALSYGPGVRPISRGKRPIQMPRYLAAAFAFCLILPCATFASGREADGQPPTSGAASEASPASDSASLDRIRAGVERSTFLAGERADTGTPTFRIEVTQDVIKLRVYWSDWDPDMEPDSFTYPLPSAAELLINTLILKPRSALSARKQRAIKKQIQAEIRQIEQQRDATAPPASPTPKP
jgi:hypothetical protein